ncbi:DUF2568 domain-containing protein [uncultured Deinococcus sp.]|uniref:DUF2568 domain-containing protein n=1 Tax=uncultured Deinococcus sp. TaxID=158789 RepID=UPI0025D1BF38|nr:DUF2568 domain-containing protein [uncultured Deinococcus sp.]
MISASDVLAFALELVAVAALTTWGWRTGGWLGAGAALLASAVVWGTFLSPRAALPVTGAAWPVAKFAVFAVAAAALTVVAGAVPAATFLTLGLVSVILGGTR